MFGAACDGELHVYARDGDDAGEREYDVVVIDWRDDGDGAWELRVNGNREFKHLVS